MEPGRRGGPGQREVLDAAERQGSRAGNGGLRGRVDFPAHTVCRLRIRTSILHDSRKVDRSGCQCTKRRNRFDHRIGVAIAALRHRLGHRDLLGNRSTRVSRNAEGRECKVIVLDALERDVVKSPAFAVLCTVSAEVPAEADIGEARNPGNQAGGDNPVVDLAGIPVAADTSSVSTTPEGSRNVALGHPVVVP